MNVGDWITYRDASNGLVHYTEIRSFCKFGREPMVETTTGRVKVAAILEVRSRPGSST